MHVSAFDPKRTSAAHSVCRCMHCCMIYCSIKFNIFDARETMLINDNPFPEQISRRTVLGTLATVVTTPALAQVCPVGPPTHDKGSRVWMDLDQIELDAAYDQSAYAPLFRQTLKRYASSSDDVRARLGMPRRLAYGATSVEALDLYSAKTGAQLQLAHSWRVHSSRIRSGASAS